jgi:hypothetical protein
LFCNKRLHAVNSALDMFDELNDFNSDRSLDIGDVWTL